MGLVADTAIVTSAEVAAITGEAGLVDLDDAASGATVDAARAQATNYLMDWLAGSRSVDPAKVGNPERLKRAAAFHVAWTRLHAQADERQRERAKDHEVERDKALALYVYVAEDAPGQDRFMPPKGLPRSIHTLKGSVFNRPIDNVGPHRRPRGLYGQK